MKMYYCLSCGVVFNFNEYNILKHGLDKLWEHPCVVCGERGMLPVEDN